MVIRIASRLQYIAFLHYFCVLQENLLQDTRSGVNLRDSMCCKIKLSSAFENTLLCSLQEHHTKNLKILFRCLDTYICHFC